MPWVTFKELSIAHDRWMESLEAGNVAYDWMRYLGNRDRALQRRQMAHSVEDDEFVVTDEGYSKIRNLNSPYWKALMKAQAIRDADK